MTQGHILFSQDDSKNFLQWLRLHLDVMTWQGKYKAEFLELWNTLYNKDLSILTVFERYAFILSHLPEGPLKSWFEWLKKEQLLYIFMTTSLDVKKLSQSSGLPLKEVLHTLRQELTDLYPHKTDFLNEVFFQGLRDKESIFLTFHDLKKEFSSNFSHLNHTERNDIFCHLEVILYKEWWTLLDVMKENFCNSEITAHTFSKKNFFKFSLFLLEFLLISFSLVLGIKLYKKFQGTYPLSQDSLSLPLNSLELTQTNDGPLSQKQDPGENPTSPLKKESESPLLLSTETDFLVSSTDNIRDEIDESDLVPEKGEGLRDDIYGTKKIYRIMINTPDPDFLSEKVQKIISQHIFSKESDERLSRKSVPGGQYITLFINADLMPKIITQLKQEFSFQLYIGRTQLKMPPGQVKLFVWIKKI